MLLVPNFFWLVVPPAIFLHAVRRFLPDVRFVVIDERQNMGQQEFTEEDVVRFGGGRPQGWMMSGAT